MTLLRRSDRAALGSCFFASGVTALMLEVAWTRQISYVLGNSLHASAVVAAAFMGGLAFGAVITAGARVPIRRSLRAYAVVQACLAACALVSIPLWRSVAPSIHHLAAFPMPGALNAIAGVPFVAAFVGAPAVLMGMTLPLVAGAIARGENDYAARVGMLYALNTCGAVVGTLLAGFVMLPLAGVFATCATAAAVDVTVAVIAFRLEARVGGPSPDRAQAGSRRAWHSQQRFAATLLALSGAVALTYEVAWFRLLALTVGPSTPAFSAMLGVYLAGLAIGSAVSSAAIDRMRITAPTLFTAVECLLGFVVVLTAFGLNELPRLQVAVFSSATATFGAAGPAMSLVAVAVVVMLVPCLLIGALFPVAVRAVAELDCPGTPEHDVGWLYGLNAAGAIVGSLLAAFLLIPWLGTWNTVLAAAVASLVIGCAALYVVGGLLRLKVSLATAIALVGAVLVWNVPAWDARTFNAGAYRNAYAGRGFDFAQDPDVLYFREGLNFPVAVLAMDGEASLRITGKADASTGFLDRATQSLLGHVPMLLAPRTSRVAVVGYGTGGTAAAILTHSSVESLTVVELEPAVLEASRLFAPISAGALDNPRVRVVVADARTYFARSQEFWDVISAEPSNPWLAGMGNLFTVEFFESVRDRLASDGVFCQWIQSYEISEDVFRAILATLRSVFPQLVLVRASAAGDWMVLASQRPIAIPWDTVASRYRSAQVNDSLRRIGLTNPLQLVSHVRATSETLGAVLESSARRLTDDDVWLEYRAFADLVAGPGGSRDAALDSAIASASAGRMLDTWKHVLPGIPIHLAVDEAIRYVYSGELIIAPGGEVIDPLQRDRQVLVGGLRAEIEARGEHQWLAAFERIERAQRKAWERRIAGAHVLAGPLPANPQERFLAVARVLEFSPDLPVANAMAGRMLADGGLYSEAEVFLQRVLSVPASEPYYEALTSLGDIAAKRASDGAHHHAAEAIRRYRQAIAWNPYRADAFLGLAEAYRSQGKLDAATAVLREARTFHPRDARITGCSASKPWRADAPHGRS